MITGAGSAKEPDDSRIQPEERPPNGVKIAARLNEIRQSIDQATDHLNKRRFANAVAAIQAGERHHREAYSLLPADHASSARQALDLLHIELRLLNQRIRQAIGL